MAKTATAGTISPYAFASGLGIFEADIQAVAEQLNYSAGKVPNTHVSMLCGTAGWGTSTNELATHLVEFPAVGGQVEVYTFRIWVDADVQALTLAAQCTHAAGQTGDVEFEVGAGGDTISFDDGDTTEVTGSDTTANTGTGWLTVVVKIENTSAVPAAGNTLDSIRIEEQAIAATDLPSPADE